MVHRRGLGGRRGPQRRLDRETPTKETRIYVGIKFWEAELIENRLSQKVIGCSIEVHRQLGPGLLESVYEEALCHEMELIGLNVCRQKSVKIKYKGRELATPLRLDLFVEEKLIIENKAKLEITAIDKQQLLTYLKLTDTRLGLIINFNVQRLVDGICRVINSSE